MGAHRSGGRAPPRLQLSERRKPGTDAARRALYGRKRGRPLRPGRRRLIETLLPRLAVALPEGAAMLDPAALFPRPMAALWLEVGFGAGEHLAFQAERHPEVGFIGCEAFVDGIAGLLVLVRERGLDNVRLFADDARRLIAALPDASLDRCFVLFPDPWPKTRHHKRRFVSPETLDQLARVLGDGAELRFASDHAGYARWTLERFQRHPAFVWTARRPSDWRQRPGDGPATRYEAKALAAGRRCLYLSFRRRPRGGAEGAEEDGFDAAAGPERT